MNARSSAVARIAGVAIVLILAAALGLIVGNALNARNAGAAVGGPGPFANVWGNVADDGATTGAPAYADPYRQIIERATANDAGPVTSESWGNIEEAASAGVESLTAPTAR